MIAPGLLHILRCPETHQRLSFVTAAQLEKINQEIALGKLKSRIGKVVVGALDGGLVREDGKFVYPIRGNLPILLIDEAIAVVP